MLKGPSSWLHNKLASVADMLASLVASWITNNAGVVTLTLAMLAEFVWRAELTDLLSTSVGALPRSSRLTFKSTRDAGLAPKS